MNDRVCDFNGVAGLYRHSPVRETGMSAEVIRFISPPPRRGHAPTDFPTIAFRAVVQADDFAVTCDDTAPCEIVPFGPDEA
jgi:hypothetical protein